MNRITMYIIWGVPLICIYIILYVGLGWFWPIGTAGQYEQINKVLLNLSYSYLAAFIFYILIDFVPRRNAACKAFLICQDRLVNIYMSMGKMIGVLKMLAKIDKEDNKIMATDVQKLETFIPEYEKTYYASSTNEAITDNQRGIFIFHEDLPELAAEIKRQITRIVALPCAPQIASRLNYLISAIQSAPFLSSCEGLKTFFTDQECTLSGFDKNFLEFIRLYNKLGKYNFRKHHYKYIELNTKEKEAMLQEMTAFGPQFMAITSGHNQVLCYYQNIEYRKINGKLRM